MLIENSAQRAECCVWSMEAVKRMKTIESRAEGGFMIVELIMASVLVALIAIGVFSAIVGATRGTSNDRHRSVAASVAQQDQERMRAFKATDLSNYQATRTVTIAGTAYTVASTGEWVSDSSGVLSCSSGSSTANYLKIGTSVTWPSMGSLKPITVQSLVAPPSGSLAANRGSLAVKVTDQANVPLQGLSMAVGSPANLNDSTDANGCAVFGSIPAGNYTLSFSQAGYVDVGGNNSFSKTTSVVDASTTTENLLYAQAGSITASFDTKVGSNPVQAAQAQSLTVAHNNLPAPGRRTWDPTGAGQTSIAATNLFPFTSGYGVYAGMCAANDPTHLHPELLLDQPGPRDGLARRRPHRHGQGARAQHPHQAQRHELRGRARRDQADLRRLHGDLPRPDEQRVVRAPVPRLPVRHLPGLRGRSTADFPVHREKGDRHRHREHEPERHRDHRRQHPDHRVRLRARSLHVMSRLSTRVRLGSEGGFSLAEVLVSIPIGLVLLTAVFTMMRTTTRQSANVTAKVEALQRGRTAMERVTRQLRSQVCPATTGTAITSADSNTMTFYTDMSGGASDPEQHTLTHDPTGQTLTEYDYVGTGTWPNLSYPGTATRSRELLNNVTPVSGVPVFRYYKYDANGNVSSTPMTVPVSQSELPRIVSVSVSFVSKPRVANSSAPTTTFQSDASVRTSDPNNPTQNARCL